MTATSLQSGMLFHALAEPGTGVDIEQISIDLDEDLDVERFMAAWRVVVDRHPILRAHFALGSAEPEVVFPDDCALSLQLEDWSDRAEDEQEQLLCQQRTTDRLTDFDLFGGSLHRFFVAKLAPKSWRILWSFHHALLDGRSFPIVLEEVFTLYDGGLEAELSSRPDFRQYIEVVANQDLEVAQKYWQTKLAEFSSISSIAAGTTTVEPHSDQRPSVVPVESELAEAKTTALRQLAKRCGVSLNTCIQAAWYLLLHHHSQQAVVTFGTTRACRHVTADAGDMIGLLINTVPMSLPVDDSESVEDLLLRLRREQVELRDHETTPLPVIRDCAPSGSGDLFDSIVVFDDASLDARMDLRFPKHAATRRFRYDGPNQLPLDPAGLR